MTAAPEKQRIEFIDAARGAAMCLILLSHFSWIYFRDGSHASLQGTLSLIAQPAVPAFVLISGLMSSFLGNLRPQSYDALRWKLLDRGLFLLTIGHFLIFVAYIPYAGSAREAMRYGQMTDAIAVAIILGPLLVTRLSTRTRLWLAAGLYLLAWALTIAWHPEGTVFRFFKQTIVGDLHGSANFWLYNFAVMPWFALYLAGTALGDYLAACWLDRRPEALARLLLRIGIVALGAGLVLRFGYPILDNIAGPLPELARTLVGVSQKVPPGPTYLLIFGGLGVLLLRAMFLAEQRNLLPRVRRVLVIMGQTSLFVFLLQELLYVGLLSWISPPYSPLWPLVFLASAALVIGIAIWWHRIGGMRFMTVGLRRTLQVPALKQS